MKKAHWLPYLNDAESRIYPQGSISIGTTVVSGTNDDRFDLDAMVELMVPGTWAPNYVLDLLWETLKDFPDAKEVVRCTRCVQIKIRINAHGCYGLGPRAAHTD